MLNEYKCIYTNLLRSLLLMSINARGIQMENPPERRGGVRHVLSCGLSVIDRER